MDRALTLAEDIKLLNIKQKSNHNDTLTHSHTSSKYTIQDYESKDGMQSAIFGPAFWMTIHITSFNYPVNPTQKQKEDYANWLWAFGNILPCRYCRDNFEINMKQACFDFEKSMQSRHTFSKFCYDLHDSVNKMLNKQSPPFHEVRDRYESFRAKCLTESEKIKLESQNMKKGCIRPDHNGKAAKCTIKIIPRDSNTPTFQVDQECCPNF